MSDSRSLAPSGGGGATEWHPARGRGWIASLGVAALAAMLYLPTAGYGLLNYDDAWLVGNNELLRTPDTGTLRLIFGDLSPVTRLRLGGEYLPMRDLSVMLDYALHGRSYQGFHVTNVMLYALACGLVFLALWRWTGRTELATVAALLYATHPLHVESVAWIAERKGLLCAVFAASTLVLFWGFAQRGTAWRCALAGLTLVAAIWSKGVAVATVGALAGLLWLYPGPHRRRAWVGWGTLVVATALAFLPLWIVGQRLAVVSAYPAGGVGTTALLLAKVHALYLGHALLLGELGIAYQVAADTSRPLLLALGATSLVAIAVFAAWALYRRRPAHAPWALAALLWLVFLAPVSQVLFPLQNPIADRYMLLPSIGWSVALACVLALISRRTPRLLLVGALVVLQAMLSLMQMRSWADDRALYAQALRADPNNVGALLQLARIEREEGRLASAARLIGVARSLRPDDAKVLVHEATLRDARGDRPGAIAALRRAVRDPRSDQARANLALLLMRDGRAAEALPLARAAARVRPLKHHNQLTLGVVALNNNRLQEAASALERAAALRPHDASTLYNQAVLAVRRKQRARAIELLERVMERQPDHRRSAGLLQQLRGTPGPPPEGTP